MRRLVICIVFFLAFIALTVYGSVRIMAVNRKASCSVEAAIEKLKDGDAEEAEALLKDAYREWSGSKEWQEALIHHDGIDRAEESFHIALTEIQESRETFLEEAARLLTILDNLAIEDCPSLGKLF